MCVLCAACTFGASTPPGQRLRIGVDLPVTGTEGRAAVPALDGIRFFVQTHPVLDGFAIELVTADDAGAGGGPASPDSGAANVQRFLGDPRILAMIGPFDGAVARKEIPIANTAGFAMVTPATSNPCLTRDVYMPPLLNPARTTITCGAAGLPSATELRPTHVNNFFRLATTDELQGAAAADFALTTLNVLRAAVISDHELYGQGLAGAFTARFARRGGTVLGHLDVDATSIDASAFLKRMKDAGAQTVYFGGGSAVGCAIRAQMASIFPAGEATPFLGGDGIAHDPNCILAAGANSTGIFATAPIIDATTRPAAAATIREFKAAFGGTTDFGLYTMLAYDATAALYAALNRAILAAGGGLPSRDAVRGELARTIGLDGVTGEVGFDASGDTTNRVVSIFEARGADPRAAWKWVEAVDYSARLPY
jgi:branched-chain amino acid transport system substrate-binding protein